jgi:hypothetical protein
MSQLYTDEPVVLHPPSIYRGRHWSFNYEMLQPDDVTVGGTGADGVATFNGTSLPAGCTKDGMVYTLSRNVNYSSITVSAGVTIITNGSTLYALSQSVSNSGYISKALDLTGYAFALQMKTQVGGSVIATPSQSTSGSTVTFTLDATTTAALTPDKLYFDIKMTDSLGLPQELATGEVLVKGVYTT